ncbi:hypothetical protein NCC49_006188 [Naganishia albida]|nr:hypothetical protein NCC49_006188 [Naganishia albida]
MESSTSPIVQIPQWYNKGPSTGFIHSPGVQVRLSQQSRVSPIDAFRNSSHPYTKNRPNMSSACSSRRGSASLASGESDSNRNVPVSNGLKDSPRRKRRPDFPTLPRSIVRPDGDDYPMDSPLLDYTQTPSILRVPFTPLPLGLHPGTSGPQSPRPEYQAPASGLPMSSVRDSSPGKAVSSGSTRHKARMNAVSRDRPATDSIPRSYVLKSLNNLAPHFWNRPATADCRIIIPIRNPGQLTPSPSTMAIIHSPAKADSPRIHQIAQSPAVGGSSPPPASAGTFGASSPQMHIPVPVGTAEPEPDNGRKILSFMLHRDYLVTQSTLFHKLLDPNYASNDAVPPQTEPTKIPLTAPSTYSSFSEKEGGDFAGVATTVWLPIPDPNSFQVLAHWLYWGDSSNLEEALARNHVTWQGLIKNIEYLGLDNRIKRVLGSWWRRWVKVTPGRRESASGVAAATASQARRKRSAASTLSHDPVSDDEDEELPFEDPLVARTVSRNDSPVMTNSLPAQVSRQAEGLGIKNAEVSPVDTAEVAKMMDGLRPSDP